MEEEEYKRICAKEGVCVEMAKKAKSRRKGRRKRKDRENGRRGCVKGESGELADPAQGKGVPQAGRVRLRLAQGGYRQQRPGRNRTLSGPG